MNEKHLATWGVALALAGGLAFAGDDDIGALEQRLETARNDLREAERARMVAFQAAETPTEQAAALAGNPWTPLRETFDKLAFEAEGTDVAAGAWSTIFVKELAFGEQDRAWEAFGVLVNDYPDTEEFVPVLQSVAYVTPPPPVAIEGLNQLVELSSSDAVRAGSLFALGRMLEGSDETREEALAFYRRVVAEFPDLDGGRGATFGERATAALFEAERLQIGMAVPDMTASDETGSEFNLSDYEGKVVLLDFWGFW